jgi:hypothetical protein
MWYDVNRMFQSKDFRLTLIGAGDRDHRILNALFLKDPVQYEFNTGMDCNDDGRQFSFGYFSQYEVVFDKKIWYKPSFSLVDPPNHLQECKMFPWNPITITADVAPAEKPAVILNVIPTRPESLGWRHVCVSSQKPPHQEGAKSVSCGSDQSDKKTEHPQGGGCR